MSSTHRGAQRKTHDVYRTPSWCTRRLLEACTFPTLHKDRTLRVLEPCAGDGAIVRVCNDMQAKGHAHRTRVFAASEITPPPAHQGILDWTAVEIRDERAALSSLIDPSQIYTEDFLTVALRAMAAGRHWDLAITNPPFTLAMEIIEATLPLAIHAAFLLRMNFLGSEERSTFFRRHMPDIYMLPNRPCFELNDAGKPATDSVEYAWFVFEGAENAGGVVPRRRMGNIEILGSTPKEERRIDIDRLLEERNNLSTPILPQTRGVPPTAEKDPTP